MALGKDELSLTGGQKRGEERRGEVKREAGISCTRLGSPNKSLLRSPARLYAHSFSLFKCAILETFQYKNERETINDFYVSDFCNLIFYLYLNESLRAQLFFTKTIRELRER